MPQSYARVVRLCVFEQEALRAIRNGFSEDGAGEFEHSYEREVNLEISAEPQEQQLRIYHHFYHGYYTDLLIFHVPLPFPRREFRSNGFNR